jgi:hypothetical protein
MKERKLLDQLGDFQSRSMKAYLDGWEGYWKFQADVIKDPRSAPEAYGRLTDAGIKSYKTMVDAGIELAQRLLNPPSNGTAPEAPATAPTPEPAAPVAAKEMWFEGAVGEIPARQFVISNKSQQVLEVAFEMSEFTTGDDEKLRAVVDLVPAVFSLEPGAEQTVECRIPIDSAFTKGRDFRGILRAIGLPEMSMVLAVRAN